jgi:hypothetical protein
MSEVWLVYVIYQYDGYDNTEVYSTKEKACEAADKLVSEFKHMSDGYTIADGFDDIVFTEDMKGDCDYIRLENHGGQVDITVEKKLIR